MFMLLKKLSTSRIIALGFAIAILTGSILLMLPCSVRPGVHLEYIDSLYTSTSAVCVTGLVSVDAKDTFTPLGQFFLAMLIQIGGLGVTAIGAGIIIAMGKKVNMKGRSLIRDALNVDSGKGMIIFIRDIFMTTVFFELVGAMLSYIVFSKDYPPVEALGISLFHSIAAFNNSGFDILGNYRSLTGYYDNFTLNIITCVLIFFGGIGFLAIPVIKGRKTDKEKFAGAEATYTIEALMHDGKALQSGTSHNFGDGFAKAFGIQYTDKDNKLKYVHQTSWGTTTRLIGAVIMTHGDDSGLVLPPKVAPVQVDVIPIMQKKAGVLDKAYEVGQALKAAGLRVKVDDSDKNPGWKFSEQEMRGIPVRVEMGPRDIEANQAVIVRRDTREKITVSIDELADRIPEILDTIQKDMLERARAHREAHTYTALNYDEFKDTAANKAGFIKAMWCGDQACEDKIKEDTTCTSRCMPFAQEKLSDVCVCCGKPAKAMVYWGKAY